ncbi:hypothetical protein Y88_1001 [Novosphingobium nitrogenifigens DSM 19370]|uniref:Uncharacterized protein n=1 Tax=Novosphingobium nitrogenifigens DSM 19370 TaxID=983920 RepID=F1Z941_9SPHN|nr:hypothetical protein Y88_1001 [Novosphingobium nitrogenifigens DSM 19370]
MARIDKHARGHQLISSRAAAGRIPGTGRGSLRWRDRRPGKVSCLRGASRIGVCRFGARDFARSARRSAAVGVHLPR